MLPGSRPRRASSGLLPRLQVGSVSSVSFNLLALANSIKYNSGALAVRTSEDSFLRLFLPQLPVGDSGRGPLCEDVEFEEAASSHRCLQTLPDQ